MRRVALPAGIAGGLFLHAMPGRKQSMAAFLADCQAERIGRLVCLTGVQELREGSPQYAYAIEVGDVTPEMFPISDFGVPEDRAVFLAKAREIAAALRAGGRVLLHCAYGRGRTGTMAVAVLLALGLSLAEADKLVRRAGSGPETAAQEELVNWTAGEFSRAGA
ncbi:MAG TPA: tyrosine-protein phosphatase [Terriglobales bacterium]|nr:tyrosine-protein phosphatase [Terriglobales bacterium]